MIAHSTDLLHRPWISAPVASRNGLFFWLAGFVVRVRYTFFLIALVMAARRPVDALLVWVGVVFVAVLVHELGHAAAARFWGADPGIELHSMGGLTTWSWNGRPSVVQRLTTTLAGPAMGFLVGGIAWAISNGLGLQPRGLWAWAYADFLWVNVGWGLFNLLPILPLDGGGAVDAVLQARLGEMRGRYFGRVTSCVVGVLVAALAVSSGETFVAVFCALLTYNNFMALRGLSGIEIRG